MVILAPGVARYGLMYRCPLNQLLARWLLMTRRIDEYGAVLTGCLRAIAGVSRAWVICSRPHLRLSSGLIDYPTSATIVVWSTLASNAISCDATDCEAGLRRLLCQFRAFPEPPSYMCLFHGSERAVFYGNVPKFCPPSDVSSFSQDGGGIFDHHEDQG